MNEIRFNVFLNFEQLLFLRNNLEEIEPQTEFTKELIDIFQNGLEDIDYREKERERISDCIGFVTDLKEKING